MTAHAVLSRSIRKAGLFFGLVALVAAGQTSHASGWFMKIEGVSGALTEGRLEGWSPIQSVSPFVRRADTNAIENPSPTVITCEIQKSVDRMSPSLIQQCAQGGIYARVTLAYILSDPQAALHRISLHRVRVSSIDQESSDRVGEARPSEKAVLSFDRMELTSFDLDDFGGTIGGWTSVYDLIEQSGELKARPRFRVQVDWDGDASGLNVSWPAESGRRYRILGAPQLGRSWTILGHFSATEDALANQFIPTEHPALFVRVEEVE